MSRQPPQIARSALVFLLTLFIGGCAFGTTHVEITHDPLEPVKRKREGHILVRPFVDRREDTQHIGNKRNGFGTVLGHIDTEDDVTLEGVLTAFFAEALREAGYVTMIQEASSAPPQSETGFDAIVDGEITRFWTEPYISVRHEVEVKLKALDPVNQGVTWETVVRGAHQNILWFGTASAYEAVIRQALTKALNQTAREFASHEFLKSPAVEKQ